MRTLPPVFGPYNLFWKIRAQKFFRIQPCIFLSNQSIMNHMSLDDITAKIRDKLGKAGHIKARVKFDFGDDGIVFVDSTQDPAAVSNQDAESDVTLACSIDTFKGFLAGTQDPNIAFMMGKLKVKGSMGLAMKLNGILED